MPSPASAPRSTRRCSPYSCARWSAARATTPRAAKPYTTYPYPHAGDVMVRLSRILKDYSDAGTLSEMIALWGFVGDAIFLTKAGAVGIAYRLTPPDTECMDPADRSAFAARLAQVLKRVSEDIHVYAYLLKR